MKHLFLTASVLVMCACGDGKADAVEHAQATADSLAASAHANVIDLAQYDLPLVVNMPDAQTLGGAEPSVVWKDETGKLEVRAGDHFGLWITEEPGDPARWKADLDRDLLKKNTVLSERPDLLIYKSEFPDDASLVFIHFYRIIQADGRSFVVQDMDGPRFNEQDVDRMSGALSPRRPA